MVSSTWVFRQESLFQQLKFALMISLLSFAEAIPVGTKEGRNMCFPFLALLCPLVLPLARHQIRSFRNGVSTKEGGFIDLVPRDFGDVQI